ncbi:unnamed protein product [Lactuca virosa]|uniref:PABS domain-containing protein n=1 Tax=Lactuca virosa TaxID=75947 RepID=A0AAU9PF94_9ASTR|nr:unnamed protein product [Lactuca virosa]
MLLFNSLSVSVPTISTIPSIPSHLSRFGRHYHHLLRVPRPFSSNPLPIVTKNQKPFFSSALVSTEEGNTEVEFQVLTAINSIYNDIVIVDTAESRMLLLDSTHNVHSIFMKGQTWTGSYWDEFATLPAIIPEGPIAIFGLGGGTAAHLMLTLWPSLQLHGWEIDEILIDKAREHLGLSDLEKHTEDGGVLHVHIGDALSTSSNIPGGYAGIVIDLFSGGEVLAQLQEVETWLEINKKLMPNGRLMVNCGGSSDAIWEKNSTINAMCKAFPGQVNWKKMPKSDGENYLAFTGPLPDLSMWSVGLPDRLSSSIKQWTSCFPS